MILCLYLQSDAENEGIIFILKNLESCIKGGVFFPTTYGWKIDVSSEGKPMLWPEEGKESRRALRYGEAFPECLGWTRGGLSGSRRGVGGAQSWHKGTWGAAALGGKSDPGCGCRGSKRQESRSRVKEHCPQGSSWSSEGGVRPGRCPGVWSESGRIYLFYKVIFYHYICISVQELGLTVSDGPACHGPRGFPPQDVCPLPLASPRRGWAGGGLGGTPPMVSRSTSVWEHRSRAWKIPVEQFPRYLCTFPMRINRRSEWLARYQVWPLWERREIALLTKSRKTTGSTGVGSWGERVC